MERDRLDALLADAVAEQAARERTAERFARVAAAESATFVGTVVDLAERGEVIAVRTRSGRTWRGTVAAAARDFLVLVDGDRPPVLIASGAIASVRGGPGARLGDADGDRAAPLAASFAAVLGRLAAQRPSVQVGVDGEDVPVLGELRAAGIDVVTLRLASGMRGMAYVPVRAITEVVLLDASGR